METGGLEIKGLPQRKKRKRSRGRKNEEEGKDKEHPSSEPTSSKDLDPETKDYEYLDHVADIKFHSWGKDRKKAFEQMVICMFSYMTELDKVEIDEKATIKVTVKGHDEDSLLFALLDEFLFRFSVDDCLVCRRCHITKIDLDYWTIEALGFGEKFSLQKHPQGTEIKAITKHDMKIIEKDGTVHVYVVVDI